MSQIEQKDFMLSKLCIDTTLIYRMKNSTDKLILIDKLQNILNDYRLNSVSDERVPVHIFNILYSLLLFDPIFGDHFNDL